MIMETLVQGPYANHNISISKEETPADLISESIFLHELVNQLMDKPLPAAMPPQGIIVNDIEKNLVVNTYRAMLLQVLETFIEELMMSSETGCVHVEAAASANTIVIRVKDCGAAFNNHIACSLQRVKPLVKKLGGCFCINSNPSQGMAVAFTLYNQLQAA